MKFISDTYNPYQNIGKQPPYCFPIFKKHTIFMNKTVNHRNLRKEFKCVNKD